MHISLPWREGLREGDLTFPSPVEDPPQARMGGTKGVDFTFPSPRGRDVGKVTHTNFPPLVGGIKGGGQIKKHPL